MSYLKSLGLLPAVEIWQGAPGPMPPPQNPVVPGVGPAAAMFPTNNLKAGDVVNVTGPFQGLAQGQVRVKFNGAPWMAPSLRGPFSAAVLVPEGAETGECLIEVNGRVVFGRQCSVVQERFKGAKPREPRGHETWKNFGDKGNDVSSYVITNESRGPGAIAGDEPPTSVIMRRRPGSPGSALKLRRSGQLLPSPKISTVRRAIIPTRREPVETSAVGAVEEVAVAETPNPFLAAGLIRGKPPAPTLPGRVQHDNAQADAQEEFDLLETELIEVPSDNKRKWFVYGGIGLAALALLYLAKRK